MGRCYTLFRVVIELVGSGALHTGHPAMALYAHYKNIGNKKWQERTLPIGLHEDVTGRSNFDVFQESGQLKAILLH